MQKKTILVVDDDTDILKFTTLRLKKLGYTAVSALDGEEALRYSFESKPDLIILDINIPKFNGYEVFKRLRECSETSGIPVIFASADASIRLVERAKELKVDAYLVKPFDTDIMMSKIEELLN